ncbi:MAG: hypothetical protein MRK01_07480 [Candidatus Scalindua sp.]|nr:hypothetical protein [Candidatus Scalindua sp.]
MGRKKQIKNVAIFLIFCAFLCLNYNKAHCMTFTLSGSQINEAIEYGQKNKLQSLGEFTKPWVFHLGEKEGWATLWSPYHNLAFKSKKAAVEKRSLTQDEIFKALRIKESLTFTVSVFGDFMQFARGYNAILYCNEKMIYPVLSYFPEFAEPSSFYPETPLYVAGCVFKFPAEEIIIDSIITLVVTDPDGKEFKFPFDLPHIN